MIQKKRYIRKFEKKIKNNEIFIVNKKSTIQILFCKLIAVD